MPIFISYSQKDRDFVDNLAANLVAAQHHVWMDRWELGIGDSLTTKIEQALTASSAILVIVSKNSVESDWCRRELNAGLVRELEEKKTLVLPCIIDDCTVPLFLRDKLYADFRKDPDQAFSLVDKSLAKISSVTQGRIEEGNFLTDFSVDWTKRGDHWQFRWTFVDHAANFPFVVLTQCFVKCGPKALQAYEAATKQKDRIGFITTTLESVLSALKASGIGSVLIKDNLESAFDLPFTDGSKREFLAQFTYRRLGLDTGMHTVVHLEKVLATALQGMKERAFKA